MTYLIAEIGNNHEGDAYVALDMVGKAIEAGVDAVKMQWFNADTLVSKDAPRMQHVIGPGNMHTRMRSLELPDETYEQAADICTTADRGFIISPFDIEIAHKANRLATQLKIASSEITNLPLLRAIAEIAEKPAIVSTGMATMDEISQAVYVLWAVNDIDCHLMHCVSIYPTQPWQANLPRIHKLQEKFTQCEIGYSDHTYGDTACIAAAAMGATTIEKHFTLKAFGDLGYDIGDHQHSLNPKEMEDLAIKLRKVNNMLRPADGMDKDMRRFLRRGESGLRGDYV